MKAVRVIVVDDSPTMQRLIASILEEDPAISVVGIASDPYEARDKIKALNPDVITLDLEMPNMNGLDFLRQIMRLRPMPVVVISSHTTKGTVATFDALRIGAVGCLEKPRLDDEAAFEVMRRMVREAALHAAEISTRRPQQEQDPALARAVPMRGSGDVRTDQPDIIAIGASTGGIEAITTVLSGFPADCPPTVITQHLPPNFTQSFAERLNRQVPPSVKEAEDGEKLQRGWVYIAPGGKGHLTIRGTTMQHCRIDEGEPVSGHRPSVDVMMSSVADLTNCRRSAALLTGMGRDGAEGLLRIRERGGYTIAQGEATCLVYGMPKVAVSIGGATVSLPLQEISTALLSGTNN
jgi:two-component system, chemotaxis family, protein-glutamate methylesterase/glutaminase